jgi:carbon monoxide dehydrogenase subunit G
VKITSQYAVPAAPERVYAALTDPAVLQDCIPGCESLTATGDNVYDARIKVGVAGLKGTYTGRAELRDQDPPRSFTLAVNGKGGPGFVRATAKIAMAPAEAGTQITCDADVQVGGLIASVGSRLVDAVARQQMDEFFQRISTRV